MEGRKEGRGGKHLHGRQHKHKARNIFLGGKEGREEGRKEGRKGPERKAREGKKNGGGSKEGGKGEKKEGREEVEGREGR